MSKGKAGKIDTNFEDLELELEDEGEGELNDRGREATRPTESIQNYDVFEDLSEHSQSTGRRGGRKPIFASSEERKQRNRQAQAAFRERRSEYIRQLEETIQNHESLIRQLQTQNVAMTDECRTLQHWNEIYRHIIQNTENNFNHELERRLSSPATIAYRPASSLGFEPAYTSPITSRPPDHTAMSAGGLLPNVAQRPRVSRAVSSAEIAIMPSTYQAARLSESSARSTLRNTQSGTITDSSESLPFRPNPSNAQRIHTELAAMTPFGDVQFSEQHNQVPSYEWDPASFAARRGSDMSLVSPATRADTFPGAGGLIHDRGNGTNVPTVEGQVALHEDLALKSTLCPYRRDQDH